MDLDGNGIEDHCETAVAADPIAAAAAFAAVDTNGDGTISVPEAAHSGWVGGKNCNHGGYVSRVAKATGDACDAATPADEPDRTRTTTDEGRTESTPDGHDRERSRRVDDRLRRGAGRDRPTSRPPRRPPRPSAR